MSRFILNRLTLLVVAFRITFRAGPREIVFLLFVLAIQGLIPVSFLYALRIFIDWFSSADQSSYFSLIYSICLWGGALLMQAILEPLALVCRVSLNEKMFTHVQQMIMEKANSLQLLTVFHEADFQKEIHYLREESRSKPMNFIYCIILTVREFVAILSLGLVLLPISPFLPLFIILASIPHAVSAIKLESKGWDIGLFRSRNARRLSSLAALSLDRVVAKEIRIFDFGPRLVKMFRRTAYFFHSKARKERLKHVRQAILFSSLSVAGHFGILGWLIFGATQRRWSAGLLVVALQAFIMMQSEIGQFMTNFAMLIPNLYFFRQLRAFLNYNSAATSLETSRHINGFEVIEFENVSFSYPEGELVLQNINLTIRSGEKIAIVGENGAGKTTFAHLLCRLYDPTHGVIRVDGVDLREIDLSSWRALISPLFQDFARYDFSLRGNIAVGNSECLSSKSALISALKKSGLNAVVKKLPKGYRTRLGSNPGDTELSGGEWQRLSMARTLVRQAPLLIFDEPTAALDPLFEREIFDRLSREISGKTAVIVTHRLGAVSLATRILVIEHGEIREDGAHSTLLKEEGIYARLYRAQAEQYVDVSLSI